MRPQEWLRERIWDVMLSKEYSLEKLYPKAGMKYKQELGRYLNGTKPISPAVLDAIAKGLGVSSHLLENNSSSELDQVDMLNQTKKNNDAQAALDLSCYC